MELTWIVEKPLPFIQQLCINMVKTGGVPRHVAFIMDGNRRFAKKHSFHTSYGHYKGAEKVSEVMNWCLKLGISEVTLYAFSIENFQRSKEEVDALMLLAHDRISQLQKEFDSLKRLGVRVHFAGRLSLISEELRILLYRVMLATRHHNKLRLNVACAYTGRDEITRTASVLIDAVRNNEIRAEDIDETLVSHAMELSEPEILIRTSGEVRLSDFMLWQVSNTVLYFSDELWPEFSVYNLMSAVVHFKRYGPRAKINQQLCQRKKKFIEDLETQRWIDLETMYARLVTKHESKL